MGQLPTPAQWIINHLNHPQVTAARTAPKLDGSVRGCLAAAAAALPASSTGLVEEAMGTHGFSMVFPKVSGDSRAFHWDARIAIVKNRMYQDGSNSTRTQESQEQSAVSNLFCPCGCSRLRPSMRTIACGKNGWSPQPLSQVLYSNSQSGKNLHRDVSKNFANSNCSQIFTGCQCQLQFPCL